MFGVCRHNSSAGGIYQCVLENSILKEAKNQAIPKPVFVDTVLSKGNKSVPTMGRISG